MFLGRKYTIATALLLAPWWEGGISFAMLVAGDGDHHHALAATEFRCTSRKEMRGLPSGLAVWHFPRPYNTRCMGLSAAANSILPLAARL